MKSVTLEGDKFAIKFPYDPNLVESVRAITGRTYRPKDKTWLVPVTSYEEVKRLTDHGFTLTPEAQSTIDETSQRLQDNMKASASVEADLLIPELSGTLYPFQKAAVAYAVRNKSVFIADEMGLGKTIEALATLQATSSFPAAVVCPASLKLNWKREASVWLPHASLQILQGRSDTLINADITILNYEVLQDYSDQLKKLSLQAIVFDESHYLKNYKTKRTKVAKTIARRVPLRLALTGTPVLNRPNELLTQLQVLGRLDEFGGFWFFLNNYCAPTYSRFGTDYNGASNTAELHANLRRTCYIRRRKAQVLAQLPPKQHTAIPVSVHDYKREEDIFVAKAAELKPSRGVVEMDKLKRKVAYMKLDPITDWINEFIETGEKLVVFAHHIDIQQALLQRFPEAAHILGSDSPEVRDQNISKFQNDPDTKVIICSIKVAGVGITLTAASNVAFVELGWTPAEHSQAEDRCHRIGQEDSVNCWYFVGEDTIDEIILETLNNKSAIVDQVTDGSLKHRPLHIYDTIMRNLLKRRGG